jgi:hypothetical protein
VPREIKSIKESELGLRELVGDLGDGVKRSSRLALVGLDTGGLAAQDPAVVFRVTALPASPWVERSGVRGGTRFSPWTFGVVMVGTGGQTADYKPPNMLSAKRAHDCSVFTSPNASFIFFVLFAQVRTYCTVAQQRGGGINLP